MAKYIIASELGRFHAEAASIEVGSDGSLCTFDEEVNFLKGWNKNVWLAFECVEEFPDTPQVTSPADLIKSVDGE